jgi:hypothetical protein
LKYKHFHSKFSLSVFLFFLSLLFFPNWHILANEGKAKNSEDDSKKLKLTLKGLLIGEDVRILPYASLDGGLEPFFGMKLEHPAFAKSPDRMFHHFKFENPHEYSWKFRYLANSLSGNDAKLSFLFKTKSDDDLYYYGVGNSLAKASRREATYKSVFAGIGVERAFSENFVARLSSGLWKVQSGLGNGREFERASDAKYFTSRFTVSDSKSIDYWKPAIDNYWSGYVEVGLPLKSSIAPYTRINLQSMTRFPVFKNTKFGIGTRFELLVSPNRSLVPYFALPEVGSRSGLRGFSKERFRNFALFALSFEYSFPLSSRFDGFLLADLAQTASGPSKLLNLRLHQSYGFGLRLRNAGHPVSIGIAGSYEGFKLFSTIALGSPW